MSKKTPLRPVKKSKVLDGLNNEQKEAVQHGDGPLLIVAGAGTGKTTVITRRIAYLIEQGIKPENILAVAFAEKAAEEMIERVDRLLPYGYYNLQVSTFHSFCERVLREYGLTIGLPDFKVLDEAGQWLLVKNNLDKFELDYYRPLGSPTKFIKALVQHFSRAKDELVTPDQYLEYAENARVNKDQAESGAEESGRLQEVAASYHTYQKLLLDSSAMDFGDLIFYTHALFKKRPAVLERLRGQFRHILVDEFQDTNYAQYEVLKLLAAPANNITVVGDDDQSIFKFRGASISNILHFKKDYPKARFITLTKNYRSGQKILDAAYKFIRQNDPDRLEARLKIDKRLKSDSAKPGFIETMKLSDYHAEAETVVGKIIELNSTPPSSPPSHGGETNGWNDFAVLARSHDALLPVIAKLEQHGLPYIYFANKGLYRKPIILDLFAYFKLLDNYHESAALFRVLNFPAFFVSPQGLVELSHFAKKKTISLYEALKHSAALAGLAAADRESISKLLAALDEHSRLAREKTALEVMARVWEDLEFQRHLGDNQRDILQSSKFVEALQKKIQNFQNESTDKHLKQLMEVVEFEQEAGETGQLEFDPEAGPEAVKLITVHGAKGLEFRFVFIVGLVDKRFPAVDRREPIELPEALVSDIVPEGDIHLMEERRLFYVGMTRAGEGLYLTRALDYGGKQTKKPSRFLIELGLAEQEQGRPTGKVEIVGKRGKSALPLPKKFSFSDISTFRSCPLEYKYRHLLGLPAMGKPSLSFGQTMHKTLEKFLRFWKQTGDGQDLFGESGRADLPKMEALRKYFDESWVDDWYDSKKQKDDYRRAGRAMLKEFYEDTKQSRPRVKFIEEWFRLKLDGHLFIGKIDRADETGDGLTIIDYKTGEPRSMEKVEKQQLLIYQWAARDFFRQKVVDLQYWYLKGGLTKVSFLGSDKDIVQLQGELKATIEEILRAVKTDSFGDLDQRTNHRSQCEYRHLEL